MVKFNSTNITSDNASTYKSAADVLRRHAGSVRTARCFEAVFFGAVGALITGSPRIALLAAVGGYVAHFITEKGSPEVYAEMIEPDYANREHGMAASGRPAAARSQLPKSSSPPAPE
jgi:hypothetical protein